MHINSYILKPGGEPLLAPVINTITNKTNTTGTSRTIRPSITAASTTSYTYTWSATGLPSGITIRASDGRISGTINSSLDAQIFNVIVTVSVTNGSQTKTDTELFNWTVNKPLEGQQNTEIQRSAGYNDRDYFHAISDNIGFGGVLEFSVSRKGDGFTYTWNEGDAAQITGSSHKVPDNWCVSANGWMYSGRYLVLGNGLTEIGNRAFSFLPNPGYFQGGGVNYGLRIKKQDQWPDLVWPAKLTKIDNYAFTSRTALLNEFDNVCEIPGRVTYIGIDAFQGVWIKKLILKEGLQVIKIGAFAGKIGTNSGGGNGNLDQPLLKIPDSVTEMSATIGTAITVANYGGDFYHGPNVSAYDIQKGIGKSSNTAPFKNVYIKASPPGGCANHYSGFTNTSSRVYIHPDYFQEWQNVSNYFICVGFAIPPLEWTSYPDAMDGAWLGEDWEIT